MMPSHFFGRASLRCCVLVLLLCPTPFLSPGLGAAIDPATRPALETTPRWAQGWSIQQLRIPEQCDIQEAYADLLTPGGRLVTLTCEDDSIEGIAIETIDWSGSPVRAKVVLRSGKETATFFVPTTRISKEAGLKQKARPVGIEAKLMELPEALARTIPMVAATMQGEKAGAKETAAFPFNIVGILNDESSQQLLLQVKQKGVRILEASCTAGKEDQPGAIELLHASEQHSNKPSIARNFSRSQSGVTMQVKAVTGQGGVIDLELSPRLVEFAETPGKPREPIFSTRAVTTSVSVYSNQTILLLIPPRDNAGKIVLLSVCARPLQKAPR